MISIFFLLINQILPIFNTLFVKNELYTYLVLQSGQKYLSSQLILYQSKLILFQGTPFLSDFNFNIINSMLFSSMNNQMQNEQLEVQKRDIGELYIRILENTQYLTNIIKYEPGRTYKLFSFEIPNIDIKSFFNLIVQTSYLLYTCYVKKVALFFSKNLFVTYQKDYGPQIMIEFLLEKQWLMYSEAKKKDFAMSFQYINPFKYEGAYTQNLILLIRNYLQILRDYLNRQNQKKSADKTLIKQFEGFDNAFKLLNTMSQQGLKPKALISCLQETQIFRTYSYLLKTLNCSIYEALRKTSKIQEIIQEINRKEFSFNQEFHRIVMQNSYQFENLENYFEDFISFLIDKKLIQIEASIKSKSVSLQTSKDKNQMKIGQIQVYKNGKHQDRVCVWKILVEDKKLRQFNQKIFQQITKDITMTLSSSQDSKKTQNLFLIQYIARQGLISVWYVSNIQVNVENTDALIYHCNNLMMQLNNVIVQHIERESTKTNKRKGRVLAFKVTEYLNAKQSPFVNIMLMIDRAMICGKVCQAQIMKRIVKIEDSSNYNIVGKRINHLSNLFLKKVRRKYENSGLKNREN